MINENRFVPPPLYSHYSFFVRLHC
jgi:hypothetical protein